MALTFGANLTDRVSHGDTTSLRDFSTWSVAIWFYPTTLTGFRYLMSKWARRVQIAGATTEILANHGRVTQDVSYRTSNASLTTNKWWFIGVTLNTANSNGNKFKFYLGDLTTPASIRTVSVNTEGNGALTTDVGTNFHLGNGPASDGAFQGRIGAIIHWSRELTGGEILEQQYRMHPTSGCALFSIPGWNGTGTQPDWSGNANNGTVTGATVGNHVPLAPLYSTNYSLYRVIVISSGSLSKTLDNVSVSSSGTIDVAGSFAETVGALSVSSSGAVAVDGDAALTLNGITVFGSGLVGSTPHQGSVLFRGMNRGEYKRFGGR